MKRCQFAAFIHFLQHFMIENDRFGKFITAVNDTVSDCRDLIKALNAADIRISQCIQYVLCRLFMSRHIKGDLLHIDALAVILVGKNPVNADAFADTLCQNLFCLGVDQLIFQ